MSERKKLLPKFGSKKSWVDVAYMASEVFICYCEQQKGM